MPTPAEDLISLREYLERLIDERERHVDLQFAAMEKALVLAREEAQRQYGHLNALRQEVMTDRTQFVDARVHQAMDAEATRWRKELEARMAALETRIAFWGGGLVVLIFILQFGTRWLLR